MVCPHKAANLVADFEAILDFQCCSTFQSFSLATLSESLGASTLPSLIHFVKRNLLSTFSKVVSLSRPASVCVEQNHHLSDHITYLRAINALVPERHWNHSQLKIGTSFLVTLTTGCLNSLSWSGNASWAHC